MNTLSYNIKYLRKLRGLSTQQVAERLGVGASAIGNYEAGHSSPDHKKLVELAKLFGVSLDILIDGDLVHNDLSVLQDRESSTLNEQAQKYEATRLLKSKTTDKLNLPEKAIPVYEARGSAGVVGAFSDLNQQTGSIIVPGYEDCNFAIQASGHSMYPVIENGCLVLCRRISDKRLILWGEIYFIRTQDHQVIKRIQKSDKRGMVMLMSDNEEKRKDNKRRYEAQDVPVDAILDLYIVKGIIKKIQI